MLSTFKTKLAAYIEKLLALATPVGTCVFIMGSEIPEGFLAFNGQKVYQSVHTRLYELLVPLTQLTKGTDETGAYVQLPNLDGRVLQATSSASSVGQLLQASLPNILGMIPVLAYSNDDGTGALYATDSGRFADYVATQTTPTTTWQNTHLRMDASRSSTAFQNSATVQPPACCCLLAIRY